MCSLFRITGLVNFIQFEMCHLFFSKGSLSLLSAGSNVGEAFFMHCASIVQPVCLPLFNFCVKTKYSDFCHLFCCFLPATAVKNLIFSVSSSSLFYALYWSTGTA
jgi:hypothetical protein